MLIAVLFITAKTGNPNFHQQVNNKHCLPLQWNTTHKEKELLKQKYSAESSKRAKVKDVRHTGLHTMCIDLREPQNRQN